MVSPSPHFESFIWRIISFRGWNGYFAPASLSKSMRLIERSCSDWWHWHIQFQLSIKFIDVEVEVFLWIWYWQKVCWILKSRQCFTECFFAEKTTYIYVYIYIYIYNIHIICYFFYQLTYFVYISIYIGKRYGNMSWNVFHWYTSRPNCIHGYITLVVSAYLFLFCR